jgi:outer membrane immunogenic protein
MKLKIALATAVAVIAAPVAMTAAAQQANVYINGGYSHFDADAVELGGITGRVGVGFGPHFAVEGEATFGVDDDGGVELDNEIGVFAVGKLPVSANAELFARAGASRVETSPGGEDDGFAYGVGGQYFLTQNDGIRLDWTRHDLDSEVDAYSLSYVRKF